VFFLEIEVKKVLEKEILDLVEQIIELTIKINEIEQKFQNTHIQNILKLICTLSSKLSSFLDGKDEYVPELLREIIKQKIPDDRLLSVFPSFSSQLNYMIEQGIHMYQALPDCVNSDENIPLRVNLRENNLEQEDLINEEIASKEVNPYAIDSEAETICKNNIEVDEIAESIQKILPDYTLIKNCKIHGSQLEYFLPEINLAIEQENTNKSAQTSRIWKDYHCSKSGITLLRLPKEEITSYRNLSKYFKKVLAQNKHKTLNNAE
jgi:hypothetical protein